MAKRVVHLIVRADGTVRAKAYARRPNVAADEVAFKITLNFPGDWGKVVDSGLELTMPAAPTLEGGEQG